MRSTLNLILTLSILAGCTNNSVAQQAVPTSNTREGKVAPEIWQQVNAGETIGVIVRLAVPWNTVKLTPDVEQAQRTVRDNAVVALIRELQGTRYVIVRQYQGVPSLAIEVGIDALRILDRSPTVLRVDENVSGVIGQKVEKIPPR